MVNLPSDILRSFDADTWGRKAEGLIGDLKTRIDDGLQQATALIPKPEIPKPEMPSPPTFQLPSFESFGGVGQGEEPGQPEPFRLPEFESFGANTTGTLSAAPEPFQLPDFDSFSREWTAASEPPTAGPGFSSLGTQTAGAREPSPQAPAVEGGLVDYARQAAQRAGIDPDIFVRQIQQESGFDPAAGSPAGARGIAQIVPRFHPGVDVTDPYASLDYAANLMKSHLDTYGGDIRKALQAYNAGPGAVASGAADTFAETKDYLAKILGDAGQTIGNAPAAVGQGIQSMLGGKRPESTPASAQGSLDVGGLVQAYRGVPYVFGGPGGRSAGLGAPSDCSGFVAAYAKSQGVDLPAHTDAAYSQILNETGRQVSSAEARPGDLVFYLGAGSGGAVTHHMGIYAGPGKVLDMSVAGGGGVQERPIGHAGQYVILRDERLSGGGRDPNELPSAPPIVASGVAEQTGGDPGQARRLGVNPFAIPDKGAGLPATQAQLAGDSERGPFDPPGYEQDSTFGNFDPPGYREGAPQPPADNRGWPGQISDAAGRVARGELGTEIRNRIGQLGQDINTAAQPTPDEAASSSRFLAMIEASDLPEAAKIALRGMNTVDDAVAYLNKLLGSAAYEPIRDTVIKPILQSIGAEHHIDTPLGEIGTADVVAGFVPGLNALGGGAMAGRFADRAAGRVGVFGNRVLNEAFPSRVLNPSETVIGRPIAAAADAITNSPVGRAVGTLRDASEELLQGRGGAPVARVVDGGQGAPFAQPEPWQMTRDEFLDHHDTGYIEPSAYNRYATSEGLQDFVKKSPDQIVVARQDFGGVPVEVRATVEPLKYTKVDDTGRIVYSDDGWALAFTDAEAQAKGLPLRSYDLKAFVGDRPVGFASNEFGSTGVWVTQDMQGKGLGTYLVKEFRRGNPHMGKIGQMTPAGRNMTGSYHRELVQDALAEGKPVPPQVLRDYPQLSPDPALAAEADRLSTGRQAGRAPGLGVVPQTDRYYHGTGAAFDTPNPATFDENGLFGPGYYLTSDPRVAGSYGEARTSVLGRTPSTIPTEAIPSIVDDVAARYQVDPAQIQAYLGDTSAGINGMSLTPRLLGAVQRQRPDVPQSAGTDIAQLISESLSSSVGPNVRAVDVPRGLRLFDVEAPLSIEDKNAIARGLSRYEGSSRATETARQFLRDLSNYDVNARPADDAHAWLMDRFDGDNTTVNAVLKTAGFDGIKYGGGKRIPMTDADGSPIEHAVTVIFPESLPKITNAISGRPGGLLPSAAPIVQRLAGQATGGAVAGGYAASQEEGATPGSVLQGAAAGALGGVARGAIGRRGTGQVLARAVDDAGDRGRTWATSVDDPTRQYEFDYRVVDLDELIPSHTDALAPNPAFPRELQPRLRERAGSADQINRIAARLSPDALLSETHRLDSGAPIVGPDAVVESGNGRILALRLARDQHPEQWAGYQEALQRRAAEIGLDAEGMTNPVLVRVRTSEVDRPAFAAEANQATTLAMSPFEQALQDAGRLADDTVTALHIGENQTLDTALRSAANRQVAREFVLTIPANERAQLADAQGNLNQLGYQRLKSALFARTYGSGAGERLSQMFLESADPVVKNVENGLMQSLPDLARAEALIRSGQRDASLTIADDVSAAVDMLIRLRQNGMSVPDYLNQTAMFGRETTPFQDELIRLFAEGSRRPSLIRGILKEYADDIDRLPAVGQTGLFGEVEIPTKGELLDAITKRDTFAAAEAEPTNLGLSDDSAPSAGRVQLAGAEPGAPVPEPAAPVAPAVEPPAAPAAPAAVRPVPAVELPPTEYSAISRNIPQSSAPAEVPGPPLRLQAETPGGPPPLPPRGQQLPMPNPDAPQMGTLYRGGSTERPRAGERLEEFRRTMVRKWTDRQVDLNRVQEQARRALGRPLNADEMAAELNRLNVNQAALTRLQETLRAPFVALGRQDLPWLSEYLTYKGNVDVAAQKSLARRFSFGLTAPESQARLDRMGAELGPERMAKVEQAADAVRDLVDSYRERMVESGIWSRELADMLKAEYPNYTPVRILDHLTEVRERGPAGRKISLNDRQLRRLSEEGTEKAREDPLASLLRYAYDSEAMIRKNQTVNALVSLAEDGAPDLIRKVATDYSPKAGEVSLFRWNNGVKEKYVTTKELAAAVDQEGSTSVPIVSGLATLFRESITRSPIFIAGQIPLDAFSTLVRTTGLEGGPQALPKVIAAMARSYVDVFKGLRQGEFKGDLATFMREGGGMAGYQQRATDAYRQKMDNLARSSMFEIKSAADLKSTLGWLASFEWSQAVGQRFDNAPRLAAFRLAQKRGEALPQAVVRGRDVTLDFSRGGSLARSINTAVPFFNVGVQASTTLGRMVRDNPKGTALSLAGLVSVPTIASEVWNRQTPEMEQDYADVPDYVKDRGLVWMLPGSEGTDAQGNRKPNYLFVPMRELAPVAIMTREVLNKAMGRESDVDGWRALSAALGASSPIQGSNAADLFNSINPIGASTGLQLGANRDFFRNRDIATERGDDEASAFSQVLAERLGVRPSQVEFAIRDLTGNVGATALAASDMAVGRDRGATGVQATPLVGGLAKRFVGNATGGQLEEARDARVSEGVVDVIRDAGFRPDEIVTPVGRTVQGLPLTQAQQTEWQQLTNAYLEREIPLVARSYEFRTKPNEREKLLREGVSRAKGKAASSILSRIPSSQQQRLRIEERAR